MKLQDLAVGLSVVAMLAGTVAAPKVTGVVAATALGATLAVAGKLAREQAEEERLMQILQQIVMHP
jgi:hypothetical protein